MSTNDEVLEEILVSLKTKLKSFHSHKRKARIYVRRFINAFSDNDKEFIIKEILQSQNRSIIKAIANKKNISIPGLGTFQYRESLEVSHKVKEEVKAEHGVTNIKELAQVDPEKADAIIDEINIRRKLLIVPMIMKNVGGKGSTVNNDFLNKKDE